MKKLSFLLISVLFIACSSNEEDYANENIADPVEEKHQEVIEIHDRVMEEMPNLSKMSKKLMAGGEKREDSLEFYSHAANVDLAKERMMQWMREYKDPEGLEIPAEEKVVYLEKEKEKMEDIEKFTNKVLDKGNELLSRLGDTTLLKQYSTGE